jgi:hypothetical protein
MDLRTLDRHRDAALSGLIPAAAHHVFSPFRFSLAFGVGDWGLGMALEPGSYPAERMQLLKAVT